MKFIKIPNSYQFLSLLKTVLSLIKLYFNMRTNKKKIIFFYFPVKAYYKNIVEIKETLQKEKNLSLFLLFNKDSYGIIKNYKDSYFLDINYLKYIPFSNFFLKKVNLFISSYVNYVSPPNSKNIYICHDISDSPLVNKNVERKLFLSLAKLHYIFMSSSNVVNYFKNKFLEFGHDSKTIPKLINTGYLKLDNVIKELKKIKNIKNHILVAPTFSGSMKSYNMSDKLKDIIEGILLKREKVIFRPHPLDLTNKGNPHNVERILNKFKKNDNFFYDDSSSYIDSYSKAKLLITDFSGTAYTFAYSTLRPVIFFSKNEKKFAKSEISNLFYFKDRQTIGFVSKNLNQLLSFIKKINKKKECNKNKIFNLRKKKIKYINKSLDQTNMQILKICKKL